MAVAPETRAVDAPRVTVVIPTYNREGYLSLAIDSVLAQTMPSFVLHVIDNGSTDNTAEVVAGYDDPRIVYRRVPENDGWINNFNRAFETGRATEYVLVLGDDDILHPDALEHAVAEMDARPRVGMRHTSFNVIGPQGEVFEEHTNWLEDVHDDKVSTGPEFIRDQMNRGVLCISTALVRSAAIPAVPYDAADDPATDFALWLRIALDWDIAYSHTPSVDYRMHPGADSARWSRRGSNVYQGSYRYDLRMRQVKVRFVRLYGDRLADPRALWWTAQWSAARRVVGRTLGPTVARSLKSVPARRVADDGDDRAEPTAAAGVEPVTKLHVVVVSRQRAIRPPRVLSRTRLQSMIDWLEDRAEHGVGGPQIHVETVRRYLESQGHDVAVVTPFECPWPLHLMCAAIGKVVHAYNTSWAEAWRRTWHAWLIGFGVRADLRRAEPGRPTVYYAQCALSADVALRLRRPDAKVVLVGH